MDIGIIGKGSVGRALAKGWVDAGHAVTIGAREPQSDSAAEVAKATGANLTDVPGAAGADIVVLATPWLATEQAIASCRGFSGRVLIDCTNPLLPDLSGLDTEGESGAERVAAWAPDADVVKAFNTIGANIMADPRFGDDRAVLPYCGDDADAKAKVHTLAADLGFDPLDAGGLTAARDLEAFALMWIHLAFGPLGREFAFKLMRR